MADKRTKNVTILKRNRIRALAGLCSIACLVLGQSAAHAGGVATGDCRLGDTQFLEGEPGSPQSQSQLCGGNYVWGTEATWYWTDEKLVIVEPRAEQFDYSAFSQLNPFTGDGYSFRKANELFPDTSRLADAVAKANFAQAALGAKPRAIEARKGVTAADACSVIPPLYTDRQIRDGDAWLAPVPLAGGPTGQYTYELDPDMTPEQRAVVLDALVQFGTAKGLRMPDLVLRAPGDSRPPTIVFKDGSTDPEMGDDPGGSFVDTSDTGRDGLRRWVTGSIELTRDLDWLNPRDVAHEIAHVFQFDDTFDAGPGVTMGRAPAGQGVGVRNPWNPASGNPPANAEAFDKCLKEAFRKY